MGFLKGDLHSEAIYKIEQWMEKRIRGFTSQEDIHLEGVAKEMFNNITTVQNFRLPRDGIKQEMRDSPRNIYERQLILEEVSN